jgi:hypothetical protein
MFSFKPMVKNKKREIKKGSKWVIY